LHALISSIITFFSVFILRMSKYSKLITTCD
jgi:hypothetical protein